MEILLKGVEDGWVRPHVDKSFPLARVGEAQTYMEDRRNIGKVVLTI
jgi:NADPH:quinone reductase-like Zn-dependent oxidoreductase